MTDSQKDENWVTNLKAIFDEHNKELVKLKQQLAIAVKALEEYGNCENWFNTYDSESADFEPLYWANKWKNEFGYKYAQEKLKQIKELNK